MSSRSIDWHGVRFIPEFGNMQGIDETATWCGAATHARTLSCRPCLRRFARSIIRSSLVFRLWIHASHAVHTTFATCAVASLLAGKPLVSRPRLRTLRRRRATHSFFQKSSQPTCWHLLF